MIYMMLKNAIFILALFSSIALQAKELFIKNSGQLFDAKGEFLDEVLYVIKNQGYDVYFQHGKISYVFHRMDKVNEKSSDNFLPQEYIAKSYRVDMEFLDAAPTHSIEGVKEQVIHHRYLKKKVVTIENGHEEIIYCNLYEGVDLRFYMEQGGLKFDFVVKPGANSNQIRYKYLGAKDLRVTPETIKVITPIGDLKEQIPEVYQHYRNKKELIEGKYVLNNNGEISFDISSYEKGKELIIDPWSTFVGGSDVDESYGSYTDADDNTYVTGYTGSANFPVTAGVLQVAKQGQYDAFLTKLDTTGNEIWSTFYGGIGDEYGYKVVVDSDNNPYLLGYTNGNDILVSSSGVFQSSSNGSYDAFVVKLDSSGNFIWGTYYGGNGGEFALSADIGNDDNVVIGGYTSSTNLPMQNAHQSLMGGALDAFVAKFDSTGALLWSTYCGGTNSEDVHTLHVDGQNNVIIAGETYSSDFPASSGAYQVNNAGNLDVFVSKYSSSGVRVFSTYFGGFNAEDANALCSDSDGYIYLAGYTESLDFPVIGSNVYQGIKNGGKDAFVAKFTGAGMPIRSTFFGGGAEDRFTVARLSSSNALYLGGYTLSSDLPIIGVPYQSTNAGLSDGFYVKLDTALTPNYSTYIGGSSAEYLNDLSINSNHLLTFSGFTSSTNFPVTQNVFQDTLAGQSDAFVFQTDSVFNLITFSIDEMDQEQYMEVIPNPFTDQVKLKFNSNQIADLIVYSIEGKEVYRRSIKGKDVTMDLSFLTKGVYILSLDDGSESRYVNRIIKK